MESTSAPWAHIVPIDDLSQEAIDAFKCGIGVFDDWFHSKGRNAAARDECKVHVCVDGGGSPVAFFTLSSTSINPDDVSSGNRGGLSGPIPAILLGKMAVCQRMQGNEGNGTCLLHHAMKLAIEAAEIVSARLLVVDAFSPGLITWYANRGFTSLPHKPDRLVCKMSKVRRICSSFDEGYYVR